MKKTNSDQLSIFNEAEKESCPEKEEPTIEEITYKRRKKKGPNKKSFEDLPVETIEYSLSEEERICPTCNSRLHEMSKEVRRELKVIPAQVVVVEHVRNIYACRNCEKENISTPIITAKMPNPILKGSSVSPSLMAYTMHRKYSEAVPLYRQEQQFQNFGIDLSRQNLANWIIYGANTWLKHLYDRMHDYLLKESILHADESVFQVLNEVGKKPTSKSYMWLYATGIYSNPIFLYEYQPSRAKKHPKKFLKGFNGFLQTDGYPGYNAVEDVTLVGCFAHAKRGFTDSLKALPKGAQASAIVYSVIETAKANNLNPFYYLTYLFEKLPNIDLNNIEELDQLLPWSDSIPENCKVPNKE